MPVTGLWTDAEQGLKIITSQNDRPHNGAERISREDRA